MEYLKHYIDSDSEDDKDKVEKELELTNSNNININNKRLQPEDSIEIPDLPESFFNDNKINNTYSNSSNNNNKRIRLFEHVDGNYPTFIYFKIPIKNRNDIKELINQVKEIGNEIEINEQLDVCYHISLSRTFPIREHHIETFTKELKKTLSHQRSFNIKLSNECCVFINDNQSRIFLSIPISKQDQQQQSENNNDNDKLKILKLIKRIDNCLSLFNFPKYYEIDPQPHLSISWVSLIDNDKSNTTTNNNNNNNTYLLSLKNKQVIKDNLIQTDSFEINKIYWNIGKNESFIDLQ